ncbi:hypothetical protein [Dactylosporangium sp. CA-139066]
MIAIDTAIKMNFRHLRIMPASIPAEVEELLNRESVRSPISTDMARRA